jgi:hypothetical protein
MRFESFSFGSIRIDGTTYEHDVVIKGGEVRKRKKKDSKKSAKRLDIRRSQLKKRYPGSADGSSSARVQVRCQ